MPMILAMNGFDDYFGDFGELGAASKSQSIANLQSALVALGKGIKDGVLMKIVIDGLIGPKTTAATNRAMTVHLGPGQAPANLRTGALSQQEVVSQADTLTNLIETEIRRRGFSAPTAKSISTIKKATPKPAAAAPTAIAPAYIPPAAAYQTPTAVTAASPVYRVPASAAPGGGGMDMAAIMKWSAIGVGAVVLAGVVYYLATKPRTAMAGFAGEGERGHPFRRSVRLGELPPHDLDTLESLVDKQGGIYDVLDGLSTIAGEKADHLRTNWQDEPAAKRWERLGRRLDRFAVSIKGKGYDVP